MIVPMPTAYIRDADVKAMVLRFSKLPPSDKYTLHLARVAHLHTGRAGKPRKWEELPEEERAGLIQHAENVINEARSEA